MKDTKFPSTPPPLPDDYFTEAEQKKLDAEEGFIQAEQDFLDRQKQRKQPTRTVESRMLRTPEAARHLGISPWQLRQLVYKKKLPVTRGKYWLFDVRDLDRFIQDRKQIGAFFYYKIRNTDGAFAVRSLHTRIKGEAEAQLDQRMTEVKAGTFNPNAEDVRVCDLMPAVWNDYEKRHRRTLDWAKARWERHLRPYLGMLLAEQVGTEDLNSYILARQKEGAKDASINRELALLKRAYHLAMKARPRRVSIVPPIDMLTEDNIRTGFVEYGDYVKLAEACRKVGLWLRAMFEVTYCYGFRRGEMLSLRVRQIDLLERVIRLDPLTTKSRRGRMVVMTESVYQLLQQCVLGKSGDDYVFTRDGEPVHDFRGAWDAVRKQAALPALLWHDLRRTGVRNQLRAGTSEKICMEISGHRTAEVFRRYDISALSDLEDAARKLEAYQKSLKDKYTDKYTLAPTTVQSKNAIDDVNYTVDS